MDPYTAIYLLVIALVVSAVLAPKSPQPTPPSLDDVEAPTADEGRPIPVIFGTVWITGPNVIWYGNMRTTPIMKSGGKK